VGLVEKQHQELRSLLATAAACTKPDGKAFENLLAPLNTSVEAISRAKEANRKDRDWFNHITVIGESAAFVAWVLNVSVAVSAFKVSSEHAHTAQTRPVYQ